MRPFRNRLKRLSVVAAWVFAASATFAVVAGPDTATGSTSYFPLAVGNFWTYRCSAEGGSVFAKTVRLVGKNVRDGTRYFRAELRVRKDKPLVYYLFVDAAGQVFGAPAAGRDGSEPLIVAMPKPGERIGTWIVGGNDRIDTPALKQVEAVRVENFDRDDPQLSAERRMEWLGRYYARGIGPVAEADGLGGECVLTKYGVKPR